jgi:plasmid stabilization system protein ParE
VSYLLHLSPAIEGDVTAAVGYYADIDPQLAMRFADEIERTLLLIQAYPLAARLLYGDVRRMVLDIFPYLLTYRVDHEHIRVQLLVHTRRDPEWIRRISRERS